MKIIFRRVYCLQILVVLLVILPQTIIAQTEKPAQPAATAGAWRSDPLHIFSESIQALTAKVTKSVVQIVARGYGLTTEKQSSDTALFEPQEAIGAGVILSADGYIVTNAHVVQGARKIRVRLPGLETPGSDGAEPHGPVSAKLVGVDRHVAFHRRENPRLYIRRMKVRVGLEMQKREFAVGALVGPDERLRQQVEQLLRLLVVVLLVFALL